MGTVVAGTNATATEYNDVVYLKNYVMNSNFDICQRWGRGSLITNPANNTFVLDRWKIVYAVSAAPSNTVHSNAILTSGDIPNSFIYYRVNPDGTGTFAADSYYQIEQRIEHGVRKLAGAGKTVTLTFWARSSITSKKLGFWLQQNYGTGGSPTSTETINGSYVTLSSGWVKYTYTFTLNTLVGKTFGTNDDDYLRLSFMYGWGSNYTAIVGSTATFQGSGTIDIAQVQLTLGDTSMEYKPISYVEELAQCQRYCFVPIAPNVSGRIGLGIANNTTQAQISVNTPTPMRTTPTVTATAADWALSSGAVAWNVTNLVINSNASTLERIGLEATVASGLTAGAPLFLECDGTPYRVIVFDAEL